MRDFTDLCFPVLRKLRRNSIVSLRVEESLIYDDRWARGRPPMFLPNLRNVKLFGLMDYRTAETIAELFIPGSRIANFEIGYRVRPCLLSERKGKRNLQKERRSLDGNWDYTTMRMVILHSLRKYSTTSLKRFVDQDELKGPFAGDSQDILFSWLGRHTSAAC